MNADGEVTSALGNMLSVGFAIGSTITLDGQDIWVISNVDGENIMLRAAGGYSEPEANASSTVSVSSFSKTK